MRLALNHTHVHNCLFLQLCRQLPPPGKPYCCTLKLAVCLAAGPDQLHPPPPQAMCPTQLCCVCSDSRDEECIREAWLPEAGQKEEVEACAFAFRPEAGPFLPALHCLQVLYHEELCRIDKLATCRSPGGRPDRGCSQSFSCLLLGTQVALCGLPLFELRSCVSLWHHQGQHSLRGSFSLPRWEQLGNSPADLLHTLESVTSTHTTLGDSRLVLHGSHFTVDEQCDTQSGSTPLNPVGPASSWRRLRCAS